MTAMVLKSITRYWADSPSPADECNAEDGHIGPWVFDGEAPDGTTFYHCATCGAKGDL